MLFRVFFFNLSSWEIILGRFLRTKSTGHQEIIEKSKNNVYHFMRDVFIYVVWDLPNEGKILIPHYVQGFTKHKNKHKSLSSNERCMSLFPN